MRHQKKKISQHSSTSPHNGQKLKHCQSLTVCEGGKAGWFQLSVELYKPLPCSAEVHMDYHCKVEYFLRQEIPCLKPVVLLCKSTGHQHCGSGCSCRRVHVTCSKAGTSTGDLPGASAWFESPHLTWHYHGHNPDSAGKSSQLYLEKVSVLGHCP